MSWTVILEDENRIEVTSPDIEFSLKSFDKIIKSDDIKLIKYLDPYGDAVFNSIQIINLISDMKYVTLMGPENKIVDEIIFLAQKCLSVSHQYLSFYGV
jgi:hypothetical protein